MATKGDNSIMSTSIHFSIKYDGPALDSHQMDVRELAPALIALSNLLEESNKTAYPNSNEVRVQVKGNFKGGSFGVDLIAVQTVAQQLVSLLSGPESTAAANLHTILGSIGLLGSGGVIGLIKWLRGKRPSSIRTDGDKVIFELREDTTVETMEVDLVTGRLYQTRAVRQMLAKVVKPLEREGVDVFACGKDGECHNVITSEDRPWFDMAASEADVVSDTVRQNVLLQIESAVFKDDNKWRFHDGTTAFFAEITDRDFIKRINAGEERFGKGDVLIADLRIIQSVTDNGLKQEYEVERILQHREPLQKTLN